MGQRSFPKSPTASLLSSQMFIQTVWKCVHFWLFWFFIMVRKSTVCSHIVQLITKFLNPWSLLSANPDNKKSTQHMVSQRSAWSILHVFKRALVSQSLTTMMHRQNLYSPTLHTPDIWSSTCLCMCRYVSVLVWAGTKRVLSTMQSVTDWEKLPKHEDKWGAIGRGLAGCTDGRGAR